MIPWHLNLNVRGGVVVGGVYKIGKKNYRFKTEGWAQDVGCADIISSLTPQMSVSLILNQSFAIMDNLNPWWWWLLANGEAQKHNDF